jgi:hypothetical protein
MIAAEKVEPIEEDSSRSDEGGETVSAGKGDALEEKEEESSEDDEWTVKKKKKKPKTRTAPLLSKPKSKSCLV